MRLGAKELVNTLVIWDPTLIPLTNTPIIIPPLSVAMGKQKRMQTRYQSSQLGNPRTAPEPTTQPQSPDRPVSTRTDISKNLSSSSKIPFRSRKIRKLSSDDRKPSQTLVKSNPSQDPILLPVILKPLTFEGEIDAALTHLRNSDPLLTALIESYRPPAFDSTHPPFLALAKSILFQQLATNAAKAIYNRFVSLCGGEAEVGPDSVLGLNPSQLREIGVSGRKASYLHDLADKYKSGALSDALIPEMDDESLLTKLTLVKGIGPWSVHMFMIFSLHRPDVLPVGDLGVRKGVQLLCGLKELPRPLEMEEICDKWKPYRTVGSWYMWRFMEAKGVTSTSKVPAAAATDDGGC